MLLAGLAVLAGLIVGLIDVLVMKRGKTVKGKILVALCNALVVNLISAFVTNFIYTLKYEKIFFYLMKYSWQLSVWHCAITLVIGLVFIMTVGFYDGTLFCKKESIPKSEKDVDQDADAAKKKPEKASKKKLSEKAEKRAAKKAAKKAKKDQVKKKYKSLMAMGIASIVIVALGMAAFTGTSWSKETFGDVDPDQMIVNIFSPAEGTSSEVMSTMWKGPVFQTAAVTFLFALFVFSSRALYLKKKEKEKRIFSLVAKRIVSLILSLLILIGGVIYGVIEFRLLDLFSMYYMDSSFIEENFADPREVKMQFPEKKRNLIHIYLESMENTYLSRELGGYLDENLLEPLTDLAKEGVTFSHTSSGFGGPIATTGCTWSVASMVNMSTGLPMKVPTGMNAYGTPGNFLPGAVTIGDILEAQGYNRTLMFGATAKFGGLNYFYESHGDFNMIDHNGAIEKGLIPEDYKVWWGYEDDKLFEFAKDELTRLSKADKPFYLVMETADTHFPDGYVGPNTPTPRSSQYANVIAYSAEEVTKFVRWIQEQPFYENTTIVLIGDHLSMDKNFFKDMDANYLRTTFNLIINPAGDLANIPESRRYNRWWFNGDMFPTMLASIGVKIEGERLGLGTNLFSDTPTIIESMGKGKEGWQKFDNMLKYKSEFYNKNILEGNNAPFDNKNITTY